MLLRIAFIAVSMVVGAGTSTAAPDADPPPSSLPSSRAPGSLLRSAAEPVRVESCDGSRVTPITEPHALACGRWTVTWSEKGKPWGMVVADGYDAVIAERERQLGFARLYARYFGESLDARYADTSPPICDQCDHEVPPGRWGEGQRLGDGAARRAIAAAQADIQALDTALSQQAPQIREVARLAGESELSRAAKDHAKQLRQAMLDLPKAQLQLDDAMLLRSEAKAKEAGKLARTRAEALRSSASALTSAVGKAVGKAHAGRYAEEGGAGPIAPFLQVDIDGATVKATYVVGEAKATWFEGTVALDGSISGRSLLAPEGGALTCQAHTEACGYVYVDATLRFTERSVDGAKPKQVAELWFRRSKWVMAKPFLR